MSSILAFERTTAAAAAPPITTAVDVAFDLALAQSIQLLQRVRQETPELLNNFLNPYMREALTHPH